MTERRAENRRAADEATLKVVRELRRLVLVQRRALLAAAVGYLILLASVATGLWLLEQRADTRLATAQTAACERVNVLREQVNRLEHVAHGAYVDAARRERALADSSRGRDRAAHERSAAQIELVAESLRVTPLTDCGAAGRDPRRYRPPQPQPIR